MNIGTSSQEVYNQERLHSDLGYHPSNELEEAIMRQSNMKICSSNPNLMDPDVKCGP
jgi:uncharacterized GH25 family protein